MAAVTGMESSIGFRGWELCTAIDLARLLANRSSPDEGRRLLQPIFEKFKEGKDTADLEQLHRLQLAAPSSSLRALAFRDFAARCSSRSARLSG